MTDEFTIIYDEQSKTVKFEVAYQSGGTPVPFSPENALSLKKELQQKFGTKFVIEGKRLGDHYGCKIEGVEEKDFKDLLKNIKKRMNEGFRFVDINEQEIEFSQNQEKQNSYKDILPKELQKVFADSLTDFKPTEGHKPRVIKDNGNYLS